MATTKITIEKLRAMSPEERHTLYQNARKAIDKGGREIMDVIDHSGLPLRASTGGTAKDDPIWHDMWDIIWSQEGKAAALAATAKGLPAMAAVDPILQHKLGDKYNPRNQITVSAGSIVGELMRHLGYDTMNDAPLPSDCVAKTAAVWKKRH